MPLDNVASARADAGTVRVSHIDRITAREFQRSAKNGQNPARHADAGPHAAAHAAARATRAAPAAE